MIAFSSSVVAAILLTFPILILAEKVDDWYNKKYKRDKRKIDFEDSVDESSATPWTDTDDPERGATPASSGVVYEVVECCNRSTQVSFCGGELTSKTYLLADQGTSTMQVASKTKAKVPPPNVSDSDMLTVAWSSMKEISDLDNTGSDVSTQKGVEGSKSLLFIERKPTEEVCQVESFYYKRPVKQESVVSENNEVVPEKSVGTQTSDIDFDLARDCTLIEEEANAVPEIPKKKPRVIRGIAARYQPSSNAIICPRIRAHSDVREDWCGCRQPRPNVCRKETRQTKTCAKKESPWSWW